ncbi:MFS transporter [Aeromicrobium ginsengisoli]|uniref:MFS transporter n=1 Tax=Aeromicrobium ginsengisoli TaxID=363867 RepID=A0A5M4FGJ9_9ACTN|nr:MFS transporter [Aeromicrobium ginsengisoli]KAA1399286.1 MFS transporter [Aeromicrobium ginsengisoli]
MTSITAPPDTGRRASYGIAIVLIAQLMLVLDVTVVNVALPRIQTDLDFSPAGLSWVLNAYTLAFGGLLLLGGRLGDVFGRLRVFEIGLGLFTVASLAGALAPNPEFLVTSRVLQGVGAAIAAPSVLALLTTSTPDAASRNRALALFTAVSSAGGSIGLILGGALTDLGSWRWTLMINVPIGVAVLALVRRFVDETARRPGRFDVVGAATATLGSVAAVYAFINAPDHGWDSIGTIGGFALAAVLLALFVRTERIAPHPLLRLGLLRNRRRAGALVVMSLLVGSQFPMFFLLVQYDQRVLGFGPLASGFAFLPLTLAIFAVSRISARLVGRFGPQRLIAIGTVGMAVSFLWLSQISTTSGYVTAILGPMLLSGASAGLAFMPTTVAILADVEPEHAGAASGLLQTMQQLGGAVGLAVIVSVYASGAVPGQVVPGAEAAFLTSMGFAVVAFLIAMVVMRAPRQSARAPELVSAAAE